MEGRLLIRDWLVILSAHYNDTFKLAQFGQPASVTRLDVAFAACPQLQPIPRLVFALLRSPILQFHRYSALTLQCADTTVHLHYSALTLQCGS